ncbi:nitrile hydratase accessory protein [Streptomyces sp. NPDC056716]|uniref:nitrile hydratase accessory protein n=1 Tax=unclassified Streptomyces TaxID=2593676 RepID=UPI0036AB9FAA
MDTPVTVRPVITTPLHESCVTDTHAPTFDADWQRRAFGVAVALSEFGHYPWDAFQQRLIAAIGTWETSPTAEQGDWRYYEHWLTALERVLLDHGLIVESDLR